MRNETRAAILAVTRKDDSTLARRDAARRRAFDAARLEFDAFAHKHAARRVNREGN